MKKIKKFLSMSLALLLLAGCAPKAEGEPYTDIEPLEVIDIADEAVALAEAPAAVPDFPMPEASGVLEASRADAVIDYSNTADGYVMVCFRGETDKRLKVRVTGPETTYTYNLSKDGWEVFPLSDGNGEYKISVYKNVSGSKYAVVLSQTVDVELSDEFAPFLRPNQYVNYRPDSPVAEKAETLTEGIKDPLKMVEAVYDFVVSTLSYDKEKASSVKSGYLPVLEEVLKEEKGICFDYAALMTAMLRSRGVPCKLVVGYAGDVYHAWISVWTEKSGWIDGAVFFNGTAWHRMDPTFASSAGRSDSIMEYIGDGSNYTEKYIY